MAHEFVLLINGELKTFDRYEDIPDVFDHVIKFIPEMPQSPHTHEQHEEMSLWNDRLKKLMEKEHARSNKNR